MGAPTPWCRFLPRSETLSNLVVVSCSTRVLFVSYPQDFSRRSTDRSPAISPFLMGLRLPLSLNTFFFGFTTTPQAPLSLFPRLFSYLFNPFSKVGFFWRYSGWSFRPRSWQGELACSLGTYFPKKGGALLSHSSSSVFSILAFGSVPLLFFYLFRLFPLSFFPKRRSHFCVRAFFVHFRFGFVTRFPPLFP